MKTTLPATKARQQFFQLIEAAEKPGQHFTITVGGEPKIIMMSYEDFEGWKETLEIMADSKLMKGIETARKEKKFYTHEEIKRKFHVK